MELHLKSEGEVHSLQSGFTKIRKVTVNLIILRYCIEENFKMKAPLYVISVDFTKAFDSVNRKQLIQSLLEYKSNNVLQRLENQVY